eukprot:383136_1
MFKWGKNKQKNKNKARAAPQAHRHPQYKNNPPRPPAVSAARPVSNPRPRVQSQPKYNPRPQPQHAVPARKSQPTLQKPPPKKQPPPEDDDDESESDDMFANMDLNEEEEEEEDEQEAQPPTAKRGRTMSVEELNKLSEEEQITLALRMSMGTGDGKKEQQSSAPSKPASTPPNPAPQHNTQPAPQPVVDKANIEWPSIPDNITNNNVNNVTEPPSEQSSAFGFVLNDDATPKEESNTKSAFGLDLGAEEPQEGDEDEEEEGLTNAEEDMFGNMNLSDEALPNNIKDNARNNPVSPSYVSSITSSPPPPLGPMEQPNVLSQLRRAEQQHERSRKRIWSQIRNCIEREQRIKQRENQLNQKLIMENTKREEAETSKKLALSKADFESAEKSKNVIRRSLKNIQDISHQLSKIGADIKKIGVDKYAQEQVYMSKSKSYKEKLDVLCDKHEETMTQKIEDEFKRIEKEEKKYKEKLDRTEREIQLDEENIERTKDRLEEIEDAIRSDVKPFQDNLDQRKQDSAVLMLEIEELEKQLCSKKNELQHVEGDVNELCAEIDSVRKTYGAQMDEISDEQSRYSKSKEEFNVQKNEYLIKLAGLTTDNEANRVVEQEFEDEIHSLKLRISKINSGFERFEEKEMRANEWRMEEERLLDEESKLNKKLSQIQYECEKYEKELKQIESKCVHHRQTIATIDSALPILCSDKSTAVNNENYLEAGKIHKTIQAKQQQKDQSLHVLKELNQKRSEIKTQLKQTQTQVMHGIKQECCEVRIKIDKQRFELICDHIHNIKLTLDDLNDLNVNNEDDVEHIVLNLELNQLQEELDFFNDKYGWNMSETSYVQTQTQTQSVSVSPSVSSEEEEEEEAVVEVEEVIAPPQKRTKKEICDEIESVEKEIADKRSQKEEVQNNINAAVANDDFGSAGQLAPTKKKLITQINELNEKMNVLKKELEEEEEEEAQEVDGSNGVIEKTKTEEENETQLANNIANNVTDDKEKENVSNDDEVEEMEDEENNVSLVEDNDEMNQKLKSSSDDEREDNGVDSPADAADKDENENVDTEEAKEDGGDMFGDMAVVDSDKDENEEVADTVNID